LGRAHHPKRQVGLGRAAPLTRSRFDTSRFDTSRFDTSGCAAYEHGVDYDTIASMFLQPNASVLAGPDVGSSPARRLRDAVEPIATHAWWCRPTNERMAAIGLPFFPAYVWGRAAALGEPPAELVVSAFAVFEPGFLSALYEEGRRTVGRAEVLATRCEPTVRSLEQILAAVPSAEVESVADKLTEAVTLADGTGRPLFAGLRSLGFPTEAWGRLWRAAELIREHRGDGHIAACVAAGLDPVSMTVLTELWLGFAPGSYLMTRGYGNDALDACMKGLAADGLVDDSGSLSDRGRSLRVGIEAATDATQAGIVESLGADLDLVVAKGSEWSAAIIAAGAFPADPLKRAAG
jgi:hypothetical protein